MAEVAIDVGLKLILVRKFRQRLNRDRLHELWRQGRR
jgi:hypothetical protein